MTAGAFFERARAGQLTALRCGSCGELAIPPRQLCPACHDEFHQWLSRVLQPLCKDGEDPLDKLYCFPRD